MAAVLSGKLLHFVRRGIYAESIPALHKKDGEFAHKSGCVAHGFQPSKLSPIGFFLVFCNNNNYCYVAGIFFPTARALIGYFEVT